MHAGLCWPVRMLTSQRSHCQPKYDGNIPYRYFCYARYQPRFPMSSSRFLLVYALACTNTHSLVIVQSMIAVSAIATSATLDTNCVFCCPCCICPDSVPLASSLCTTINMQLLHGMRSMRGLCGVSLVAISSLALDLLQGRHRPSAQHLDGSCSTILWMISPTRGYSNRLLTRSTDRSSTHTERNFGMNWYSCCFTLTAVNATWISTRLYNGMLCGDTGL